MSVSQAETNTFTVGRHTIQCLDEVRALLVDKKAVRLSPTEYRIMRCLLQSQPTSDEELAQEILSTRTDYWTREAIDRHVDNIKFKFKKQHLCFKVRRISKFGYMLVCPHLHEAAAKSDTRIA